MGDLQHCEHLLHTAAISLCCFWLLFSVSSIWVHFAPPLIRDNTNKYSSTQENDPENIPCYLNTINYKTRFTNFQRSVTFTLSVPLALFTDVVHTAPYIASRGEVTKLSSVTIEA